jgi:hypothetical protein
MITVVHIDGYMSLHCWSLFRLLCTSTLSSYVVKSSVRTRHNQHTMHDYQAHRGNDLMIDMMDIEDYKVTACPIKLGS